MDENNQQLSVLQGGLSEKVVALRGELVILDSHLAAIYGMPTSKLNQNIAKNPDLLIQDKHWFKITPDEKLMLLDKGKQFNSIKFSKVLPKVYTPQGVFMLPTLIRSKAAKIVHVQIIDHYVQLLSKSAAAQDPLTQRVELLEKTMKIQEERLGFQKEQIKVVIQAYQELQNQITGSKNTEDTSQNPIGF